MNEFERRETPRLLLRRPTVDDVDAIRTRYASDAAVVRYLGWRRHQTRADTEAFLASADDDWRRTGFGSLLAFERETGVLVGSTGVAPVAIDRVLTGYVLARDSWGRGYATEMGRAMIEIAAEAGFTFVEAHVHVDHHASAHVLEKLGFTRIRSGFAVRFPNLATGPDLADAFERRTENEALVSERDAR